MHLESNTQASNHQFPAKKCSKAKACTLCQAEWGSRALGWPLGWAAAGGPVRPDVGSPAPAAAGLLGAAPAAADGDPAGLRLPKTGEVLIY
jgi:hypothetical protein